MAVDIDAIAPKARERYLAIGERYAAPDVLAQGDKTLLGLSIYSEALVPFGFGLDDGSRLTERREALLEHVTSRTQSEGIRKVGKLIFDMALQHAKDVRVSARTVLGVTCDIMLEAGDDTNAQPLVTVLSQTRRQPSDVLLLDQLKALHPVLAAPVLAPLIAPRGGPAILERLIAAQTSLRDVLRGRASDPERTGANEHRHILNGMVVASARSAHAASRVAARSLGQPAIAHAFKLDLLRRTRSSTQPVDETPEVPETDPPATTSDTSTTA
jgi:hypothetical protein